MEPKKNIRHCSAEELIEIIRESSFPPFHARQLYEWIWKKSAVSFDEMTSLPAALRDSLAENYEFGNAEIIFRQESNDGSVKYIFRLHDGQVVEGVFIPSGDRITVCISTQSGCALNCAFCATARIGFKRDLDFTEIYDQVALLNKEAVGLTGKKISNIVVMGMGEPLLNYDNLLKATEKITSPDGLGFSPQRITVSTAGIADKIKKLGDDKVKFNLALSLNIPCDEKRSEVMPVNKKYPLEKLRPALKHYYEKTRNIITLEYILIAGLNDSDHDITCLKKFTAGLPVKINLIEYNEIAGTMFRSPSSRLMNEFKEKLEANHYIVNIRKSRGKDIAAACGQLAGKM